ncbi:hypothetical protein Franean1_5641 [Parafrankia sp. EAN1pec]|nr:hypothetical protein Franean1_5641 [Frankia sp. EAN1pec]
MAMAVVRPLIQMGCGSRYSAAAGRRIGGIMHGNEFATMEWIWDQGSIRINLPGGREMMVAGSYNEVVAELGKLGGQGWDVASSTASSNWIFWTLRRASYAHDRALGTR